jgi:sigma-B regulation protein RsbU (phosphoserine phosphatase)
MPAPERPPALLLGDAPSLVRRLATWLSRTLAGRLLVLGLLIKGVTRIAELVVSPLPTLLEALDTVGSLALVLICAYAFTRLFIWARRRLLWRVRRKLILSYVFVGLVPGLLIVIFFLLAGLLLFFNVSSYLAQSRMRSLADQARFLAQSTQIELQRSSTAAAVQETLERRQASAEARYPFISMSIVPVSSMKCDTVKRAVGSARPQVIGSPLTVGPWTHLDPPERVPSWVTCDGFAGLIAYEAEPGPGEPGTDDSTRLALRAVALPDDPSPTWAVILDMPVTSILTERIREETGIRLGEVSAVALDRAGPRLPRGRVLEAGVQATDEGRAAGAFIGPSWVAFLDYVDWETGESSNATAAIQINVWQIYDRISTISPVRLGEMTFGQLLLAVLAVVGVLFLIIQLVALIIGFALARQITGAVHDLFTGTQYLRNRDLTHQIPVRKRDQLGELAESFNAMTGEITTLLKENAEKVRLEQEIRTARDIQMKLLPQGPLLVPGLAVTAYCEPAREVGGDYYDFLPVSDRKLGFLIADVSGKGTSAALYMAELKGLMLSLSRIYESPRDLLIAANRVIAPHIDAASFITMSYIVVDLDHRTMTYARAGHCPLIFLPAANGTGVREAQVLAPDGMVAGLKLDDGQLFDSLLQEIVVPLSTGDLIVLFTDGFSEAMNETFDCFGENRLSQLIEQYGDLPFEQLREKIVAEVRRFAGAASQHDDMTMILLKVEEIGVAAVAVAVPVGVS